METALQRENRIIIKRVSQYAELEGIRHLQEINLKRNLPPGEAEKQGFVTAEYSLEFLEIMHRASPSVIALDGDRVVGYALVATRDIKDHHAMLSKLFGLLDQTLYKGRPLETRPYVVVGQLCVAKDYRGRGLTGSLYDFYRKSLQDSFDCCVTDVASDNPGSLRAHLKTGFCVIDTLSYDHIDWSIVLWDWTT